MAETEKPPWTPTAREREREMARQEAENERRWRARQDYVDYAARNKDTLREALSRSDMRLLLVNGEWKIQLDLGTETVQAIDHLLPYGGHAVALAYLAAARNAGW